MKEKGSDKFSDEVELRQMNATGFLMARRLKQ